MNKLFLCIIILCALMPFASAESTSSTAKKYNWLHEIEHIGYHEILNVQYGSEDYKTLYDAYDKLLDNIYSDQALFEFITSADLSFKADKKRSKFFANAPMGFLHSLNHGKKNKVFFHFSEEYHAHLKENHAAELAQHPILTELFRSLTKVNNLANEYFEEALDILDSDVPGLKKTLYQDRSQLTLITKVVSYLPISNHICSHPHYDFSGLTVIMDNDDKHDENLKVSFHKQPIYLSDFKAASRQYKRKQSTSSALLMPGLALNLSGIKFNPTPHMVLATETVRHALIVFAMVPYKEVNYDQIRVVVSEHI